MPDSFQEFDGEALRCWSASLRMLGRSDKSEFQLRKGLALKGFDSGEIDRVIHRLYSLDYLNDQRFAEAFVRSYSSRLGVGQLQRKLAERGVAEDVISAAVSEYAQPDQLALAVQIAERKFASSSSLPKATMERRITSLLLRRGFSASTAWAAIRHLQQRN